MLQRWQQQSPLGEGSRPREVAAAEEAGLRAHPLPSARARRPSLACTRRQEPPLALMLMLQSPTARSLAPSLLILLPCAQAAHTFADLHDTPGRMLAKGVIAGVVPLRRARAFFYWRLRRKLQEHALARRRGEGRYRALMLLGAGGRACRPHSPPQRCLPPRLP